MPASEVYPINEFLHYITFQKRYSKHTIISYETDLKSFFDFLQIQYNSIDLKDISASIVRSWLASLKANKITSKTINRKISTLKSFFKYQLKINKIEASPVCSIISLKINQRLPSFIEQKDINELFNEVEFPDNLDGKTNRLLLMILYQTGIRLSELINIKEQDIYKLNNSIKVLGKGSKARIIPVSNQLLKQIAYYISEKRKLISQESANPFLFINKKNKKLYPKYVYNVVKKYLGDVSTNERKSPHVLRHTFATHLTNNGADINAIKELLGHSSLASTQIYTHNSIDKLKQVHKLAHPKS
jgi:integrase/recombinase XerC